MGLFDRLKAGLQKTHSKLVHEIKRVVTGSPKLTGATLEELEAALLSADLGVAMTQQIIAAVRKAYETQGGSGLDVFSIARDEVKKGLSSDRSALLKQPDGVTVVSIVGVNGTGKTTTTAKLAHLIQQRGETALLAACDTFRAAAIEQLKLWGKRLNVPVIAGAYGADPAAIAHDGITAAVSRKADFLLVDTAGRLHTRHNLMQELHKLHRVMDKKLPGAPHEVLLVLDSTNGQNAIQQAKQFHEAVGVTAIALTKLDGTAKGGVVLAIADALKIPIRWVGVGEGMDDLVPFDPEEYAAALTGSYSPA